MWFSSVALSCLLVHNWASFLEIRRHLLRESEYRSVRDTDAAPTDIVFATTTNRLIANWRHWHQAAPDADSLICQFTAHRGLIGDQTQQTYTNSPSNYCASLDWPRMRQLSALSTNDRSADENRKQVRRLQKKSDSSSEPSYERKRQDTDY